ncbi:MAG: hypothetical protein WBG92_00055 [Thiohalocapsa sp.]
MHDAQGFTERLRQLIGRDCHYYGRNCRIVEVLPAEARVVLEFRETTPPIQSDQYGQAAYRCNEHLEVPLFDVAGDLSEELIHLLEGVRRER